MRIDVPEAARRLHRRVQRREAELRYNDRLLADMGVKAPEPAFDVVPGVYPPGTRRR